MLVRPKGCITVSHYNHINSIGKMTMLRYYPSNGQFPIKSDPSTKDPCLYIQILFRPQTLTESDKMDMRLDFENNSLLSSQIECPFSWACQIVCGRRGVWVNKVAIGLGLVLGMGRLNWVISQHCNFVCFCGLSSVGLIVLAAWGTTVDITLL